MRFRSRGSTGIAVSRRPRALLQAAPRRTAGGSDSVRFDFNGFFKSAVGASKWVVVFCLCTYVAYSCIWLYYRCARVRVYRRTPYRWYKGEHSGFDGRDAIASRSLVCGESRLRLTEEDTSYPCPLCFKNESCSCFQSQTIRNGCYRPCMYTVVQQLPECHLLVCRIPPMLLYPFNTSTLSVALTLYILPAICEGAGALKG